MSSLERFDHCLDRWGSTPAAQQGPAARALGPAVRLSHVAVAGRGCAQGVRALLVIASQCAPCEPHGRRAEILLRARQLHRAFPGLGDAALRLVLAASGHRVAALADARRCRASPRALSSSTSKRRCNAPPQTYIDAHAFDLSVGEVLDVGAFRDRPSGAGYVASSQAMAPGEFAVRGSIIDLYPMGSPRRIASICSTTRSRAFACSIRRRSAPASVRKRYGCCPPANSR